MTSEEIDKFKKLLMTKRMSFQYVKKSGDIRKAEGTANLNLMPKEEQTKERKECKKAPDVIRYYDFGKNEWRSFHETRLIDFEGS